MKIIVLGFGIMGAQISSLLSLLGYDISIYTKYQNLELFNKNKKKLSKLFNLPLNDQQVSFMNHNDSYDVNSLVIECVSENLILKKEKYEKFKKAKYGFFTNTSSFVNTEIGENVNALHFFNPINLKILEISLNHNKENLIYFSLIDKLKSISFKIFEVNENRGYLGNSIVFYQISNFFYLYEKLSYRYEDIIKMSTELNMQLNPISLVDLIGVDTCLKILENLNKENKQIYIPKILQKALNENILGKKNKTSIKMLLK